MNDQEFQKILHEQGNNELMHELYYFDFANWALEHGMLGFYCKFKKQAMGEIGDAKEVAWYSIGTQKLKPILNIQFVSPKYGSLLEIADKIVLIETENLKRLNILADELRARGDLVFYSEIKEYAEEQKHEVEAFKEMQTKIRDTGNDPAKLKYLDDEMYNAYLREKQDY